MNEAGLTRQKILTELTRSPHGNLKEYIPVVADACAKHPEFLAHLIAWNHTKGQVRDSKLALPLCTAASLTYPQELLENSFAHLAKLNPRDFVRGYRFGLELRLPLRMRVLRRLATAYLREFESTPYWQRTALQHRAKLKELYALSHTKPSPRVNDVLFKNDYSSAPLFQKVKLLHSMSPLEAAGTIMNERIPFLIAVGALGAKAKEPDLVLALIKAMSPTELVTNTKFLERLGVKSNPALRAAFEEAVGRASSSKANMLKTTRAAEQMTDEGLKQKLQGLQEKQLASLQVEGDWLVLADKSGSMSTCIEASRHIAAALCKFVKGKVWLVFFDTAPQTIDVTGCTLDMIRAATKYITADGGTSIGCGLQRMLDAHESVDGIAIVSDACENTAPSFWDVYRRYCESVGKDVPVYLYLLHGGDSLIYAQRFLHGHDIQVFDLKETTVDYYSLPNLVQTMRTNRYSLLDEVMATKLLTFKDVFDRITFTSTSEILGKEVKAKNA